MRYQIRIRANFEGSEVPLFDTTTTHAIAAVDRSLGAMTKT
jgi:aspartate/glutamate racemase